MDVYSQGGNMHFFTFVLSIIGKESPCLTAENLFPQQNASLTGVRTAPAFSVSYKEDTVLNWKVKLSIK